MSRLVRNVGILLVAASLSLPLSDPASGADPKRPNILLITTDDQRMGTLGVMSNTRRWLVRRGVKYPRAYVTTPLCCPSKSTIYTGQYTHNHGVVTNEAEDTQALDQSTTVQRYLDDAGYRTALFGKFLNGWDISQVPSHFDRWAFFVKGSPFGYSGATWNVSGRVRTVDEYSTSYVRRKAAGFLRAAEANDGRPWFAHLSMWAPHLPVRVQRKYRDAAVRPWKGSPAVPEADRSDKPPYVQARYASPRRGANIRTMQLRALMSVDDAVHRLMRLLGRLGERRNTLVIFLSDNGFLWGEHGITGKVVPYTPSIHVPLLVRWPRHLEPGTIDRRVVLNADVAPTILDAAGIEPHHTVDGRSLLDPSWERDRLFVEEWKIPNHPAPAWESIRTTDMQYVEYRDRGGSIVFREYYDLRGDPWQLRNLLGDGDPGNDPSAEELAALEAQLAADRVCTGTTGPLACP